VASLHILSFFAQEAFGEGGEFAGAAIGLPGDAAVGEDFMHYAAQGAFEGFHTITGFEIGDVGERDDAFSDGLAIKHAGDVMGGEGCGFAPSCAREFREQRIGEGARDFGEGVAVEEKERSFAMKRPEPI
jgi:hypothetical protein